MDGLILIDKPKDYTSFDIVAKMRKILEIKKIGHTGTLDPLATGVLPILVGKATKVQDILPNSTKEYIAEFKLGVSTDTLDISGKLLNKRNVNCTKDDIINSLNKFKGNFMQMPPMYSALKKDGKKLYDLARKGITIERKERPVTVNKIELLSYDENNFSGKLLVNCSKGTYIRSICNDLGEDLGCGGIMVSLRRTICNGFNIKNCITLEEALNLKKDKIKELLIPISNLFECYDKVYITLSQTARFKNGGELFLDRISDIKRIELFEEKKLRVFSKDNEFLGLGIIFVKDNVLKIYKLFCC